MRASILIAISLAFSSYPAHSEEENPFWAAVCREEVKIPAPIPNLVQAIRDQIKVARNTGRLESFSFSVYDSAYENFRLHPELTRPEWGLIEEDVAYAAARLVPFQESGENLIDHIIHGNNLVLKVRLLKALDKARNFSDLNYNQAATLLGEFKLIAEKSEMSVMPFANDGLTMTPAQQSLIEDMEAQAFKLQGRGILDKLGMLRDGNAAENFKKLLRDPKNQFWINLNLSAAAGLFSGSIPYIGGVGMLRFGYAEADLLKMLYGPLTREDLARFESRYGPGFRRGKFRKTMSKLTVWTSMAVAGLYGYAKYRINDEKQKEAAQKTIDDLNQKTKELAEQNTKDENTPLSQKALEAWVEDYKKEHGGSMPDTLGKEYRDARELYRKLLDK